MARTPHEPFERWVEKIQPAENGCWNWTASVQRNGYGRFWRPSSADAGYTSPHRFAYEFFVGPIPAELQIDHLCSNRRCANPDHLELVTPQENQRRGAKARQYRRVA